MSDEIDIAPREWRDPPSGGERIAELEAENERLRAALATIFPSEEQRPDGSSVDHSADGNLEAVLIELENGREADASHTENSATYPHSIGGCPRSAREEAMIDIVERLQSRGTHLDREAADEIRLLRQERDEAKADRENEIIQLRTALLAVKQAIDGLGQVLFHLDTALADPIVDKRNQDWD